MFSFTSILIHRKQSCHDVMLLTHTCLWSSQLGNINSHRIWWQVAHKPHPLSASYKPRTTHNRILHLLQLNKQYASDVYIPKQSILRGFIVKWWWNTMMFQLPFRTPLFSFVGFFFSVLFTMPTTKNKNTHFIKKIPTKNLMKVKIPYFLVACKAKAEWICSSFISG